uniref:Fibronectin type-III domain-containing protein n=1 Tax=Hucho hucho TaxID=62062 RepID=A0A4W5PNS6_9TELE
MGSEQVHTSGEMIGLSFCVSPVPTAPPQAVEVTAVSSSTIRFTWNPPPQQFINGINQGYKLLVWPEHSPEAVTIVTITPDYPGSRLNGLVVGLRKFTWYLGSALCFTTPGDGPKSPPILLQTHEDSTYTHTHFSLPLSPLLSPSIPPPPLLAPSLGL